MSFKRNIFTHYVGRMFLVRFVGLLVFFVIVLQMLDLLNRSSDIMAAEGAGVSSMIRYVSLRAPQIISQFTPFAALLGVVLTLAGLSHTSEITVMRAAGMSVHRVLFPLGFVCALVALSHFAFHELVVVRSSEALDYWEVNDYAVDLPPESDTRTDIRINYDGQFIAADSAARIDGVVMLTGVSIVDMSDGLVAKTIEARGARFVDGAWRLYAVRTLDALTQEASYTPEVIWTNSLEPELLFAMTLEPDQTSLPELSGENPPARRGPGRHKRADDAVPQPVFKTHGDACHAVARCHRRFRRSPSGRVAGARGFRRGARLWLFRR